jgi:hypothetical protein
MGAFRNPIRTGFSQWGRRRGIKFLFVFCMPVFRISAGKPATVTEVYRDFPQSPKANAAVIL